MFGKGPKHNPDRRNLLLSAAGALIHPHNIWNTLLAGGGAAAVWKMGVESQQRFTERREALHESPLFLEATRGFLNEYERNNGQEIQENEPYPVPGSALAEADDFARRTTIGGHLHFPDLSESRVEYLRRHIMEPGPDIETIPPAVREEISYLMPGLAAVESRFHNGQESNAGAQMILQFMPSTYRDYGKTEEEMQLLSNQVEVARLHFAKVYNTLIQEAGPALDIIQTRFFGIDETAVRRFHREFLTLAMIDGYHAGASRIAELINTYAERHPTGSLARYDVYTTFAQTAQQEGSVERYGDASRDYTPRVYAFALLMNYIEGSRRG